VLTGKRFHIFTLLGFRVNLDLSWFLIAILISWSLATGYFPAVIEGLDPGLAWTLGIAGALGLFASIILHEFSHAMVARRFGMPISDITLFIFGGVAELKDEPTNARAEFLVAVAGPLASYVLAGAFHLAARALSGAAEPSPLVVLLSYLALLNLVLATFNLLPAFPLDGGRMLRAAVWGWTGNLMRATRTAATMGRLLGGLLLALGLVSVIGGNFVGGMWQALIGFFIISAARASESQMAARIGFEGLTAGQLMARPAISVPAEISLSELVDDYFYRHFHKAYPVVRAGKVIGCVHVRDASAYPRADWAGRTVADILPDAGRAAVIAPDTPVWEALKTMNELQVSRLAVADDGVLAGILTMRDLMTYLSLRETFGPGHSAEPGHGRASAPTSA